MQPKRILISLLVVMLLTFCMITAVSAAEIVEIPAPSFSVNTTLSEDKATLEVSVAVDEAYATEVFLQAILFEYDPTALELVSCELNSDYVLEKTEDGRLTIGSDVANVAAGEILKATFSVKDVCEIPAVTFFDKVIAATLVEQATVTLESDVLDAHVWDEGVVTEPTCTDEGYTTLTCQKCGDTKEVDPTDALGHDETGAPATCDTAKVCPREGCGVELAPAIGHKAGAMATCTTPQVCVNNCGKVYVEALGHLEGPAATCTTDKVCLRNCGHVYEEKLGHIEGPAADCENDQVCTREECGEVLTDKLGHLAGAAATCTTNQVCTREGCGKELAAALGHKFNVEAATCDVAKVCSVCNVVDTPALGHNYGEWVLTTEATRKADGVNTKTCARCNGQLTEAVPFEGGACGWLIALCVIVFLAAAGFAVYWFLLRDDIKEKGGVVPYCKSLFGKKESTESEETTNENSEESTEEVTEEAPEAVAEEATEEPTEDKTEE